MTLPGPFIKHNITIIKYYEEIWQIINTTNMFHWVQKIYRETNNNNKLDVEVASLSKRLLPFGIHKNWSRFPCFLYQAITALLWLRLSSYMHMPPRWFGSYTSWKPVLIFVPGLIWCFWWNMISRFSLCMILGGTQNSTTTTYIWTNLFPLIIPLLTSISYDTWI